MTTLIAMDAASWMTLPPNWSLKKARTPTRYRLVLTNNTMKTTKKQTQCQRLLAYLKKNRKGITVLEAFTELGICCLHKRIADLEDPYSGFNYKNNLHPREITRTRERTTGGAYVTRYKLAR
jgi:hypothetical protein